MLAGAIAAAVERHKSIAEELIDASEIEVYIEIAKDFAAPKTGAPMFADMDDEVPSDTVGPFKALWSDADAARVGTGSSEGNLVSRYTTAEVVAKVMLEDVLVDITDPYGQTYFDKALNLKQGNREYQVLGYDRYGLGTTTPYIIAVALRGNYED